MGEDRRCPSCGGRLGSAAAAESSCPACLMRLGLLEAIAGAASDPPKQIGPYHLRRRLGEGGMGEVWEADQEGPLRRKVAIKLIKPGMDTRQVIARFDSERQALAVMSHPSVAQVFDAGSTPDGRPYFVMEYVEGMPITSYCDQNRLSTKERLELFVRVCEGVQHAHHKGIIHRDIKPSNILVTESNGQPTAKIIDFGVAKATEPSETERSFCTDYGLLVGTPEYMSPEQAEMGKQDIDTRTDVYSLGLVLYELLVGALPFDPRELRVAAFEEIRRKIREEVPSRPSARLSTLGEASDQSAKQRRTDPRTLARQIRGDLDWITMKALEKDRLRRYGTAAELGADIGRYLGNEPVLAGPPGLLYGAGKFVDRHRWGVAAVVTVFLLLAGLGLRERIQARRIAVERDTAERVSDFLVSLFKVSDPSQARGETITAREILDRGAEKVETELANEPLVRGRLMKVLGVVHHELGLYEQAATLLSESVEVLRRERGGSDPETLGAVLEMAINLRRRGKLDESETLTRETLEQLRRVLGDDHLDTLRAVQNLASTLRAQDRLEEAETYSLESLEGTRRLLGEDHPDALATLHNHANLLYSQGKYAEAETHYKALLESMRVRLGEDHPSTLSLTHNVGAVIENRGEFAEAQVYYQTALDGRRLVLGNDHPQTLLSMAAVAKIHTRQGRLDVAETLARESLAGHRRVLGDEHPMTLFAIETLAWVLWEKDAFRETEQLFREALEVSMRTLGAEHQSTLRTMHAVAGVLWDQNEHEEAEGLYLQVLEGQLRVFGEDHRSTVSAIVDLAGVYDEWGKPAKAAELRRRFPNAFSDRES